MAKPIRLRDIFYEGNPYHGFDPSSWKPDSQGWNSIHIGLIQAVNAVRPKTIVEVGVWKGSSLIHMAKKVKKMGIDCEIIAVDTWLGSPERVLRYWRIGDIVF
ncbi:MAG: hypothetical protein QNJ97_25685 [Myxococcota bacterium]|nr:hypothetical protein [Myxococcota bacterium]